jgi:hypothetical protein
MARAGSSKMSKAVTSRAHSTTYGAARRRKSCRSDPTVPDRGAFHVFQNAGRTAARAEPKSAICIRLYRYGRRAISERFCFKTRSRSFKIDGPKFPSAIVETTSGFIWNSNPLFRAPAFRNARDTSESVRDLRRRAATQVSPGHWTIPAASIDYLGRAVAEPRHERADFLFSTG